MFRLVSAGPPETRAREQKKNNALTSCLEAGVKPEGVITTNFENSEETEPEIGVWFFGFRRGLMGLEGLATRAGGWILRSG